MTERGWSLARRLGAALCLVLAIGIPYAVAGTISERPDATLPLTGAELIPVVQNGLDRKVTSADLGLLAALGTANATHPTLIEGSEASFSFDLADNARMTLGTNLAGEDLTATGAFAGGVLVTELRYLSSGTKTADFQVKATPGFVHSLYCIGNDGTAAAGTIKIFDNTAESGTELYSLTITATDYSHTPIFYPLDVVAATGIYLGFTTTNDVSCTVAYR